MDWIVSVIKIKNEEATTAAKIMVNGRVSTDEKVSECTSMISAQSFANHYCAGGPVQN